jgi:threonine dehydratase
MMAGVEARPDLSTIRAAHARIKPFITRTPILTNDALDTLTGAKLFFKCENLQKVGAFKFRGATNAVQSLTADEAARGVVTHSSGNHAAALSLAAKMRGIPAYIVMPRTASQIKKDAVASFGGQLTFCEPALEARDSAAAELQRKTGAVMIHPFDDYRVIAGQGTAALELLEDVADLDVIITPVGGGGLLAGTAIAAKGIMPSIKVIGAEPSLADDAAESLRSGRIVPARPPKSAADGLLSSLGHKTFPILRDLVDEIAIAPDEQLIPTAAMVLSRARVLIEPSSAVVLAALLSGTLSLAGKRVGLILSGGNVEVSRLARQ